MIEKRLPPQNFHRLYVHRNGSVSTSTQSESSTLEVYGSPLTSQYAMTVAATIVSKMTRNMPPELFNNAARSGCGVGVFTRSEKVTIYPNYAYLRNTKTCGRSCSGDCDYTCTGDGRKYENLPGLGGKIGAILDDNLLCTKRDPYWHKENILVHEFAHTLKTYALSRTMSNTVSRCFQNAKANETWTLNSYAMRTIQEYWAEASQVFMGVSKLSAWNAAGMNLCHGKGGPFCKDYVEGRQRLKAIDPEMYKVLLKTWTNNRPNLDMGMFICPPK